MKEEIKSILLNVGNGMISSEDGISKIRKIRDASNLISFRDEFIKAWRESHASSNHEATNMAIKSMLKSLRMEEEKRNPSNNKPYGGN